MDDLNQKNVRSDMHTNTVARLRKIADDLEKNSFMLSSYKIGVGYSGIGRKFEVEVRTDYGDATIVWNEHNSVLNIDFDPPYSLNEYSSNQWWYKELEKIMTMSVSEGCVTDNMKRAAHIACNLMRTVETTRSLPEIILHKNN